MNGLSAKSKQLMLNFVNIGVEFFPPIHGFQDQKTPIWGILRVVAEHQESILTHSICGSCLRDAPDVAFLIGYAVF